MAEFNSSGANRNPDAIIGSNASLLSNCAVLIRRLQTVVIKFEAWFLAFVDLNSGIDLLFDREADSFDFFR